MNILNQLQLIQDESSLLFSKEAIDEAIQSLSHNIDQHYQQPFVMLCVLTGGLYSACELSKKIQTPHQITGIQASRYHQNTSGSKLTYQNLPSMIQNQHVLIVDDCMDEGITLEALKKESIKHGATSVKTAVLLNKTGLRTQSIQPDFCALTSDTSQFVFGFGLDIQGYLRNLTDLFASPLLIIKFFRSSLII